MKKLGILCLLLCFLVSMALPAAAADLSVEGGCHSVDAQRPLTEGEKLTSTATAAMIYERGSDTMIYADNPDGKMIEAALRLETPFFFNRSSCLIWLMFLLFPAMLV